jgi:hypothetical protein
VSYSTLIIPRCRRVELFRWALNFILVIYFLCVLSYRQNLNNKRFGCLLFRQVFLWLGPFVPVMTTTMSAMMMEVKTISPVWVIGGTLVSAVTLPSVVHWIRRQQQQQQRLTPRRNEKTDQSRQQQRQQQPQQQTHQADDHATATTSCSTVSPATSTSLWSPAFVRDSVDGTFRSIVTTAFNLLSNKDSVLSREKVEYSIQDYESLFAGARTQTGSLQTADSIRTREKEYETMINHFYNLVTDFYEYGWGQVRN